jgi:hypothetical protein
VAELKSRDDVEAWIKARPTLTRQQDAVTLAARAALRAIPVIASDKAILANVYGENFLTRLTHVSFRAAATARLFIFAPNSAVSQAARFAAGYSFATADTFNSPTLPASWYVLGLVSSAANSVNSIESAAYVAVDAAAHSIDFQKWNEITLDASSIEDFGARATISMPLGSPAWKRSNISSHWSEMKQLLQSTHSNQSVWIGWYERIMNGGQTSLEEEEAYALINSQDIWAQGSDAINDAIAKRLQEIAERESLEGEKAQIEAGAGATIVIENDQLRLRPVVDEGDIATADDPMARQLHAELLKALPDFVDQARRYGNREGWTGLDISALEYAELVQSGLPAISQNVVRFWTLSCKIGSFINQDDDLRAGNGSYAEPLDADGRQTILNVLAPGAPLVRRFPTGLILDEDYQRFNEPRDRAPIAITLIQSAKQQQVLHGPSADIINDALEVGTRTGVQAVKSRSWAERMARAVALTVLIGAGAAGAAFTTGVVKKIGEKVADKSVLAQRLTDFLLSEEQKIVELTKDLPPDLVAKNPGDFASVA